MNDAIWCLWQLDRRWQVPAKSTEFSASRNRNMEEGKEGIWFNHVQFILIHRHSHLAEVEEFGCEQRVALLFLFTKGKKTSNVYKSLTCADFFLVETTHWFLRGPSSKTRCVPDMVEPSDMASGQLTLHVVELSGASASFQENVDEAWWKCRICCSTGNDLEVIYAWHLLSKGLGLNTCHPATKSSKNYFQKTRVEIRNCLSLDILFWEFCLEKSRVNR